VPILHLLEGVVVGFVEAMPIGPIGILCIRRSIAFGRKQGVVTGLAGATADIFYITVALFSIRFVADFVALEQHAIRLCGGIAVIVIGIFTFFSRPASHSATSNKFRHTPLYASTFLLALSNPVPLLGFAALLTAIGFKSIAGQDASSVLFIVGVFLGSLLWFLLLANVGHAVRGRLTDGKLMIVNKIAGLILFLIGVAAAGSSLSGL
jgi:threonine/homoserine/homoserine lactone efflux protein